ncbi:MAG: enoyl-CoA hydratase/isomerase family protein [Sterolibacterium sp.]|nr:enoyl-CoA hydratase/isomerase family protein [Sterolibacterium sp.]
MPSTPVVLVDSPAPHVARLLINRPDKRNAIDYDVRQSLIGSLGEIFANPDNRSIVFGGAQGVFSAGGDLPTMLGLVESQARERMRHIHSLCRLVANTGLPVVTAIEGIGAGAAVGLALLGDYIVVGYGSRILFPFMKLGLTPDWGTLHTLPRRVGLPAARRILTQTQPVDGPEALRIGLADALVADDEVMDVSIAKAVELSKLPLGTFAKMKQRLNNAAPLDVELAREEDDQVACLLGPEFIEGYAAFKEKRSADFMAPRPECD